METLHGSVAAYLRLSLDSTGQAVGTTRQAKRAAEIARQHGLPAPVDYLEPGSVSASRPRKAHTAYARLLTDVRAGRVKVVIVWDVDRLTRQPREIEDWLDLCERHEVRIITMDGEVDTRSDNGRMFLRIKGVVTRAEVERKGTRQKDANRDRAERGQPWRSNHRVLGYSREFELIEDEAEAVRDAYRGVLAGAPLRAIRARWEESGPANPNGGARWPASTFRAVLTQPLYSGRRTYRGVDYPVSVPTIVDEDTWRAVQVVLADPARRTTDAPGRPTKALLSGIARCGRCQGLLTSGRARDHRTKEFYRTLRCFATPHLSRRAAAIEDFATEHAIAVLRRPDFAELFLAPAPDLGPLRARAAELRTEREVLAEDIATGYDLAKRRDQRLLAELERVEGELAAMMAGSALAPFADGDDPEATWLDLSLDGQRAALRELVDVVVLPVGRGRGGPFDPETVRVTPRGGPAPGRGSRTSSATRSRGRASSAGRRQDSGPGS